MIQVIQFILALSLLIVLHEGGHFFFARLFKTRVEKFYLFFDFLFPFSNILPFSLFKKKIGDTVWGVGWFPLGGYVKIAGMVDESMDKEQLAKPPEPWEFRSKKPYQRLLIMLGGIIVNVLLAFIIYAMILFTWGKQQIPVSEMKYGISLTDSLAYKLGFREEDKIVAINGHTFTYYDEILKELPYAKQVVVERQGETVTLNMAEDWIGNIKKKGLFDLAIPSIIDSIIQGSPAQKAGLQKFDKIVGLNNETVRTYNLLRERLKENKGKEVQLAFERDGTVQTVAVALSDTGTLGFYPVSSIDEFKKLGIFNPVKTEYGFFESFPAGVSSGIATIKNYWRNLKLITDFKTGAYKQTGGFISMASIYSNAWDWHRFWNITAFISIALAIMNLLPIPGLDGGYVVFTLYEMITGRKVNEKVMEVLTTIGLVLLLLLMLAVNLNDIVKWLGDKF
jgi:regulator of sigma E protease